jgi:hypothetical protein
MSVLGFVESYACSSGISLRLLQSDSAKFVAENNDSHGYVDEHTDNTAIATIFRHSKFSGIEPQTFKAQFSAIFSVNPNN